MPALKYDLTGQRFAKLIALHHVVSGRWLVRCDCGTEKVVAGQSLRNGGVKSCGCLIPVGRGKGRPPTGGAAHPRWAGDDISYSSAHRRVAAKRGPAREHPCSNCGGEAHSWAYRGGSPMELIEERPDSLIKKTVRYSPDPDDYDPMCWSCHARKDIAEAQTRA